MTASRSPDRARALPQLLLRAPWWLVAAVGLVCIALGGVLILRPISALSTLAIYIGLSFIVSGLSELLAAQHAANPRTTLLIGAAWVVGGVLVLLWIGTAISLLPIFLAVALLVTGVIRIVGAIRGARGQRLTPLLLGATDIVFGVLALQWPDVTLLIVSILFGARTIFFGISRMWDAIVRQRARRATSRSGGARNGQKKARRIPRWVQPVGAGVALLLAVGAAGLGTQLHAGSPLLQPFYTAPAEVPGQPGQLIRSEPFTVGVPGNAQAWRILYTTTNVLGEPTVASGYVLTPTDTGSAPHPVISWAHGTTGYAQNCASTLLADPYGSGGLPQLDRMVDNGWAVVATDYAGMGTNGPQPYLIGEGEARSVLDASRAAAQLSQQEDGLNLATETVVWGHSQGGGAAIWTGGLAASYAPDVNIVGVAGFAPATDAIGLVKNLPNLKGGSVFASFVVEAYDATYPELDMTDYLEPASRTIVREMASRCLSEPGALVSVLSALSMDSDTGIFAVDPTTGDFGVRLEENTPRNPVPFPLLVAQGLADPLVLPAVQRAYVQDRCETGQELDFRVYEGRDHMGLVADDSPFVDELFIWTADRFAGVPFVSNCDALPDVK